MEVKDFDYDLPEELIAQEPLYPRDASRLLYLQRSGGQITHTVFNKLGAYLQKGDLLVLNDTKVLPARIYAHKPTGAQIELLLLQQVGLNQWQTLVKPGKKAQIGSKLLFDLPDITAEIIDYSDEGSRIIRFAYQGDFFKLLEMLGEMPLPPYIKKKLEDQGRYQPVYARERGSAAAPTAGLHFTEELLERLAEQGIANTRLLLHVGLGTFRPVKAEKVEDHHMHAEFYRLTEEVAEKINKTKRDGGRIIAVGTTSCRTLETLAKDDGTVEAGEGYTRKFIYPGYQFKLIDGLITNFHLPKSTLLMLVSAFAGRENVLAAYQEAINQRYRFFSFGDAMLII
ncbi:MAG: tRNA preQ1(34) S-adenosylmethionine ribosyltransferase-isomerase QueA [Clostridia bacterium]|nr:tRNA preQ1(34) S-adenosylmethionine ribosyltransferase-isomerase QueA [Clostridia bacterium]